MSDLVRKHKARFSHDTALLHIHTGYDIEDCNVTAIARLRGKSLKTFNIPFRCIGVYNPEAEDGTSSPTSSRLYVKPDFGEKVLYYDKSPMQ